MADLRDELDELAATIERIRNKIQGDDYHATGMRGGLDVAVKVIRAWPVGVKSDA